MAAKVSVDDVLVTKPGESVRAGANVRVRGGAGEYASRGGTKLAFALDAFSIDVSGQIALDAGASAGGFTECLLRSGAARVYAVDVGHGQLHSRIAADPRVVVLERTNISDLSTKSFADSLPSFCTADLSYLSLTKAVPILEAVIEPGALMVCLVKPLFEGLETDEMRDPESIRRVLYDFLPRLDSLARRRVLRCVASPVAGSKGAVEFFALLGLDGPRLDYERAADAAVEEAVARHSLTSNAVGSP